MGLLDDCLARIDVTTTFARFPPESPEGRWCAEAAERLAGDGFEGRQRGPLVWASAVPLKLEGNLLTVDNRTKDDWEHVEIWLNTYYRVTVPVIQAGGRFQAPGAGRRAGQARRRGHNHRRRAHEGAA